MAAILKKHRTASPLIPAFFVLIVALTLVVLLRRMPPTIWHDEIVDHTEVVHHPRPDLNSDDTILGVLGCPITKEDWDYPGIDEEWNFRYCGLETPEPLTSLGCFLASTPYPLLGGLEPSYPMVECDLREDYVYQQGCFLGVGIGYVILRNGEYELIDSQAKLRSVFAPIDSEQEALSYALAATRFFPLYGIQISSKYEYYVTHLEDTYVTKKGNDYLVHLYDYLMCGCKQHETLVIDLIVTRSGRIRQVSKELVFRDANEKCID